jgi:DNA polymerase-3 subunit delta
MYLLASEVDKLCYFVLADGRTVPTDADLRLVCTPASEYDAFAFANAVMDGRREDALSILADYKLRRTDPLLILGDVVRTFCDLEGVASMTRDGASPAEISNTLRIHEYRVGLYRNCLRNTDPDRLRRAIDACYAADTALKLSPQGYTALERLICSL